MKNILLKFSKRERLIFIFTVALIAGIFIYAFILDPLYKKWSEAGLEVETAAVKLSKNVKLLANKDLIEKEYERYKGYLQDEGDKEQVLASVLKEIEAAASGCGVKITSIKPKGEKQLKGCKKYSIELAAEAQIGEFMKFIYELENSKKLLKVERLVLSLKGAQPDLLKGTLVVRKLSF